MSTCRESSVLIIQGIADDSMVVEPPRPFFFPVPFYFVFLSPEKEENPTACIPWPRFPLVN